MLIDTYRYMISGYFGVKELDSYDLKLYILKEMENYIREFASQNPCPSFDYLKEKERIEKQDIKTKLQDALLLLNKMDDVPIDLIIMIKSKLKNLSKS